MLRSLARSAAGRAACVPRARAALLLRAPQHRPLSSAPPKPADDDRDAYFVLGVQKGISDDDLHAIYKSLAREWHPDRHQGDARAAAEEKFQEISEAYQVLSDPVRRKIYDDEIDAAKDAASRAKAKKRFRAATWNTEMPDMQERLRSQKKEEPTTSRGAMAFVLLFVTGNFVAMFNMLAG